MAIINVVVNDGFKVSSSISGTITSYLSQRNKSNCQFNYRIGNNNYKNKYNQFKILTSNDDPLVYLHEEFVNGTQNADLDKGKLIDYPQMQQPQIDLLNDFFERIFNNQQLEGTNKPSDRKQNGDVIEANLTGYYHYHCGPYAEHKGNYISNLSTDNWYGSKSGPAIHYLKYTEEGKDVFIIVAFVISHGKEPGNPTDASFKDKNKIIEKF